MKSNLDKVSCPSDPTMPSVQASLDERLSGFESSAKRFQQRRGDMEKTTKKAALDRAELQKELDDLTGRSRGDAMRATEV